MPDPTYKKISELSSQATASGTHVVPVVVSGTSKKMSLNVIKTWLESYFPILTGGKINTGVIPTTIATESYVDTQVSTKATPGYVDNEVATLANGINAALANKASTDYVDTANANFQSQIDGLSGGGASQVYVDAEDSALESMLSSKYDINQPTTTLDNSQIDGVHEVITGLNYTNDGTRCLMVGGSKHAIGKRYCEVTLNSVSSSAPNMQNLVVGMCGGVSIGEGSPGISSGVGLDMYFNGGYALLVRGGMQGASLWCDWNGTELSLSGIVVGIAIDALTGKIDLYKNGVLTGTYVSPEGGGKYFPAVGGFVSGWAPPIFDVTFNFGATAFAHAIPDGYCAYDSPEVAMKSYVDAQDGALQAQIDEKMSTDAVGDYLAGVIPDYVSAKADTSYVDTQDAALRTAIGEICTIVEAPVSELIIGWTTVDDTSVVATGLNFALTNSDAYAKLTTYNPGRRYCEITIDSIDSLLSIGVLPAGDLETILHVPQWQRDNSCVFSHYGRLIMNNPSTGYVVGIDIDGDTGIVRKYVNGAFQEEYSSLGAGQWVPAVASTHFNAGFSVIFNIGETAFAYPIPDGCHRYGENTSDVVPCLVSGKIPIALITSTDFDTYVNALITARI